ncbi:MAG: aminoglycoside phosphotransferase family protein [Acidimicrobiia bacterium]
MNPVPGFAGNQSFSVEAAIGRYLVKCGATDSVRAEAWVCDRVREEGVPAPAIVDVDLSKEQLPLAFLVMEHVGGAPVDDSSSALETAGAHLRVVHAIELDGFGWLGASESGDRGTQPTWFDAMTEGTGSLAAVVDAGLLPARTVADVERVVDRHRDILDAVQSACLLHGDFHPRHVFADDRRLCGIIDWGDATAGDPLFDLGRVLRSGRAALDRMLVSYGPLPVGGDELERRLQLYLCLWVASSVSWEFFAGPPWPPWFDLQNETLVACTAALATYSR